MTNQIQLTWRDGRFVPVELPKSLAYQYYGQFITRDDINSIHELELICLRPKWVSYTKEAQDRFDLLRRKYNAAIHLKQLEPIKVYDSIPDFTGTLKAHQHNPVGCLSSASFFLVQEPVGRGKTIETVAACCLHQQQTIIVCLAKKVEDWKDEFNKHSKLNVIAFDNISPQKRNSIYETWDTSIQRVLILSYEKAESDKNQLIKLTQSAPTRIYLDEGSKIKNPDSTFHKAMCAIREHCVGAYILNATTYRDRATDYWSAFNFLKPGLMGSIEAFNMRHCLMYPNGGYRATINQKELRARIAPFTIQRTATEIDAFLGAPKRERTDTVHLVDIDPETKVVVDKLRRRISGAEHTLSRLSESGQKHSDDYKSVSLHKNSLVMKEIRALISPFLLGFSHKTSTKYDKLCELIEYYKKQSIKCIVFSRWKDTVHWIQSQNPSFTYIVGYGGNDLNKRIKEFRTGNYDVLLATDAIRLGHNLPECGAVIHLDMPKTVEAFEQRNGRIDRGDLEKALRYEYILIKDSREHSLFQDMLDNTAVSQFLLHGKSDLGSLVHEMRPVN